MNKWKEQNVLITGGAGFIGSNLAAKLVRLGANIVLVDSLIPEYGGMLTNISGIENKVKLNISDVRDLFSMKHLVQGVDFVFNLAGQTSHMDSMQNPFVDLDINAKAQLSILECCRLHNPNVKIVFASTRQIYGKPDYLPVDEVHPARPVDVNGINKVAGESYHLLYNHVYGIRSSVLRLTNTYGPRMRIKDARQTFVGIWIRRLLENMPFEVWGGEQLRDFNYVDDVVEAMLLCAERDESDGKVYNLGSREVVSLQQLAEMLVDVNGEGRFDVKTFPEERKRIDIGDYYADYGFIERELGWAPKVSLREGVSRTLAYYRDCLRDYTE